MDDKNAKQRGILAGLLGLFGEEEEQEQERPAPSEHDRNGNGGAAQADGGLVGFGDDPTTAPAAVPPAPMPPERAADPVFAPRPPEAPAASSPAWSPARPAPDTWAASTTSYEEETRRAAESFVPGSPWQRPTPEPVEPEAPQASDPGSLPPAVAASWQQPAPPQAPAPQPEPPVAQPEPPVAQPEPPLGDQGISVSAQPREAYEPFWYAINAASAEARADADAQVSAEEPIEATAEEPVVAEPEGQAQAPEPSRYDFDVLGAGEQQEPDWSLEPLSPAVQASTGQPAEAPVEPAPMEIQPPLSTEDVSLPAEPADAEGGEPDGGLALEDGLVFEIPLEFAEGAQVDPEAETAEPAEPAEPEPTLVAAPDWGPVDEVVEPEPADLAAATEPADVPEPVVEAVSWEAARVEEHVEPVMPEPVVDEPPAPEPVAYVPPAPAVVEPSPLSSTDPEQRRAALQEMIDRGLAASDAERVTRLLLDPERDVRRLAVQALVQVADHVPADQVRRALQDPTDQVRAAAVHLAVARQGSDLPDLLPMLTARRWPLSQAAALEVLPRIVGERILGDGELAMLLAAVSQLESAPIHAERAGFAGLARAIGRDRLMEALSLPDERRLGAARLLFEEGSGTSLRAVAGRDTDPIDELRYTANQASDLLRSMERVATVDHQPEPRGVTPSLVPQPGSEGGGEVDMIAGLAKVLHDPDESVRARAAMALSQVSRSALTRWARQAIRTGTPDEAALGGRVAELTPLVELAPEVLERAADLPAESRGALMQALAAFGLPPGALVDLIGQIDPSRRQEAIRLLWQVSGRTVLPYLRDSLKDSSGPVRMAVLEVFGESGDPAAIEVAHTVLEMDSSPAVRATAIQVMGRAGLEQRVASLAQALSDPDPDVRSTAVEVLPQGMGRDAAPLLLKALGDHDERVWTAAMRHLVMLPERDLPIVWSALRQSPTRQRDQLIDQLERTSVEKLALLALEHVDSPDYAERIVAVELAGRAGTLECTHAVIRALQDPAPPVRRTAAAALSGLRSPAAVPALGRALSDPDPEVRVEAVRALGVVDDDEVLQHLVSALKDPETRVREMAIEALTHWSSPTVAKRLAEVLATPDLRRPASELLARMGASAVEPLLDALVNDPEVAPTAGELLERIVGPDVFLDRLSSMDANDRLRAVEALGAIGGPPAVDGLMRTLSDPDQAIRVRAVRLLGELGDPRAFESVKRAFLGDPVLDVVNAAEEALRKLQPDEHGSAGSSLDLPSV